MFCERKAENLKTFIGGVHPKENKFYTEDQPIKKAAVPEVVVIPMAQHTGAPCMPVVKVGETVKKGQLIGSVEQFIASPVHASTSGAVKEIKELPHPVVDKSLSVVIASDGKDEWADEIETRTDVRGLGRDDIIKIVKDSGIVGMGGAAFPSHVKLKPPKKIDTVILNGAECEPYLTCDNRLMIEKPKEILKGLSLIMKALDVVKAVIAIESNKPEAISVMDRSIREIKSEMIDKEITVKVLRTKYPQGAEKQLIDVVLARRVPPQKLPLDVGCVVHNAGTALAVYEAVYLGRPLVERCVTVSGDCLEEPLNLQVRIGTQIKHLIDECKGLKREISKLIIGGPMMGIAQHTLEVPVIKGTSGILLLSAEEARVFDESPCIRCGRCVDACPMNLLPLSYAKFVKKENWAKLESCNIDDCMECGACSYTCPSRIPIVQYIKAGKRELFYRRKRRAS
ncbi:MAG: electron transport complex subunit RsxC [Candidatus Omnitrophica bacterium]|nr:electron transport complex subunit RsxC [Candidatus Omnitrophota bacterium]